MSQKFLLRQIITAGMMILAFSLIALMLKADTSIATIERTAFQSLIIQAYLVMIAIPIGYCLSLYFAFIKHSLLRYFRWFWGILLALHLVLQALIFFWNSPLHWLAGLASIFLSLNHWLYLK